MSQSDESDERTHYSYSVSLRISHPSIDPEEITNTLVMQPSRYWKVGAPRQTPAGKPIKGTYGETFWTVRLINGRWPTDLNEAIHGALQGLVAHRAFFHRMRIEGGNVEFFIGWFFDNQSGDTLKYQCLALAGDLQIDLSFDVYPPYADDVALAGQDGDSTP